MKTKSQEIPQTFTSIKEVLKYLKARGFKISQAGLYKHQNEGKIAKDKKAKAYTLAAVDKYGKNFLTLESTGKKISDEADQLQVKKLNGEIRRTLALAAKAEHDLKVAQGQYINKEEMIRELVGRALIQDSSLRHLVKTGVPEWIDLVEGDHLKAGILTEAIMAAIDQVMNSFASTDDFMVVLDAAGDE